jgi:molybdenum cofactor cytidylyltransferase
MDSQSMDIAGVILAAGSSTRFGKPKSLLDWFGQSLIRKIAKTALEAGLSPVQIVIGAVKEPLIEEVTDLPVNLLINKDWEMGMSSGVRLGVCSLSDIVSAAIFMLVDQPQISSDLLLAIKNKYQSTHAKIIAPQVHGKRANPVLFDRSLFGELQELQGDTGGRSIMNKYEVTWLLWDDESILEDIDTQDDYDRLRKKRKDGA